MKIIEALKKIKDLQRKCDDIRDKIGACSAKMSFESDRYEDQKTKISSWLQGHHDMVAEIETLRERISKTNLATQITIEIGGRAVTKSVYNWISRRRDLSQLDLDAWKRLTDRGLSDQRVKGTTNEIVEFKVVRFYDPELRDKKVDEFEGERYVIDAKLEITNAVTDLVE